LSPGKVETMTDNRKNLLVIMLIAIMLMLTMMVGCSGSEAVKTADTENTPAASQEVETTEQAETVKVTEPEKETVAKVTEKETSSVKKEVKKTKENTRTTKSTEAAAKPTQKPTETTETAKVCYITVEGHCSSKSITLKSGDSVYDILKRTGASVSARSTGYGVYVEGINGRFEFDEGPTSGWIYTVNGSRPSTSCSNYSVSNGDEIVWTYVEEI